jgi:hypothetical protein
MVVAIGSNTTTLSFNDVVSSLLSKEMRQENMEDRPHKPYLQEGTPEKETDLSPRVGDQNLREYINLPEIL